VHNKRSILYSLVEINVTIKREQHRNFPLDSEKEGEEGESREIDHSGTSISPSLKKANVSLPFMNFLKKNGRGVRCDIFLSLPDAGRGGREKKGQRTV